jgi:cytochrome c
MRRLAILAILIAATAFNRVPKPIRVLIFSKTNGYHHASISTGITAIEKLGT